MSIPRTAIQKPITMFMLSAVVVLLGLWGLMATSAPVGWWSWIAEAMPHQAAQHRALPLLDGVPHVGAQQAVAVAHRASGVAFGERFGFAHAGLL